MKKLAVFCRVAFFIMVVSPMLSNCMTESTNTPVAAQVDQANAADQSVSAADYRISARDILQITVFQVQDLNNAVQVGEDGNVALPLVGKVHLSGKTTFQAEQEIAGKLRQKYLQSPQVTVSVKEYGKRITVSGEVKAPKVLSDDGNTTLTQAIANAGGLSELGNSSRVHIARSRNGHVQDQLYSLDEIQAGQATDPVLRGGDIVVAESSTTKVGLKTVTSLLPFAVLAALW